MASNMSQKENVGNISISIAAPPQPQSPPPYQPQTQLQPQFPYPQGTYPAQQYFQPVVFAQPTAQRVVVVAPALQPVIISNNLGDTPGMTTCSNCHQRVMTRVIYKTGLLSWVACFIFIVLGLICGCCLLPFFVTTLKDAHHSCPLCHNNIYVHKRI